MARSLARILDLARLWLDLTWLDLALALAWLGSGWICLDLYRILAGFRLDFSFGLIWLDSGLA